jgi:hypothetical protein
MKQSNNLIEFRQVMGAFQSRGESSENGQESLQKPKNSHFST